MSKSIFKNHTDQNLKTFIQHGFKPLGTSGNNQVYGNCLFCGSGRKPSFYINVENKTWDCKRCDKHGGFGTFLKEIVSYSQKHFDEKKAKKLAVAKGLKKKTLVRAGFGFNPNNKSYIIPVPDINGDKLHDVRIFKSKKMLSTSGCKTGLFGWEYLSGRYVNIWLCEGEWDCLVMREVLRKLKKTEEIAVSVPGANTFKKDWITLFRDMNVNVLYDNDEAGRDGSVKVFNLLQPVVKTLNFLHWKKASPQGQDIRDLYLKLKDYPTKFLKRISISLKKEPQDADKSKIKINPSRQNTFTFDGPGHTREEVYAMYDKWLLIKDRNVLDVLYATFIANRLPGDPVWMFLMASAGATKTEFVRTFEDVINVTSISSLTPKTLISGATFSGGGDPSLIPRLDQKILLIKDFTSILDMNQTQREEIFGQLRDAYDGKCAKPLGNGVFRVYESKFGILAAVTHALELYTQGHTALGERFLTYCIQEPKNIDAEHEIIMRAMNNVTQEDSMRDELRAFAAETLNYDYKDVPDMNMPLKEKVLALSQWTAMIRGTIVRDRYTKEITHKAFKELGTRLAKQYSKFLLSLGMFRRIKEVTEDEYSILPRIATSSVPSKMRAFIKLMYNNGKERSWTIHELSERVLLPVITCERTAEDLKMLGALKRAQSNKLKKQWVLSDTLQELILKAGIYKC